MQSNRKLICSPSAQDRKKTPAPARKHNINRWGFHLETLEIYLAEANYNIAIKRVLSASCEKKSTRYSPGKRNKKFRSAPAHYTTNIHIHSIAV